MKSSTTQLELEEAERHSDLLRSIKNAYHQDPKTTEAHLTLMQNLLTKRDLPASNMTLLTPMLFMLTN